MVFSRIEAKAQTYIEKVKDDNYIEDADIRILTTTRKALSVGGEILVWSVGVKEERLVSLNNI